MSEQFGVAEILQRTRDDTVRPELGFDIAQWAYANKAGAVSSTIVDVQAGGTAFGTFTAPRAGLYRILATASCGVAATVRIVRLRYLDATSGEVWEHRFTLTSGSRFSLPLMTLYLPDGGVLQWITVTALVLGDDLTGSITNWELVI